MKRVLLFLILFKLLITPVNALEMSPPEPPSSTQKYMPTENVSFWEDLLYVLSTACQWVQPEITAAARVCMQAAGITMLLSILDCFTNQTKKVTELVGTVTVGVLLMKPSNILIALGVETVTSITDYGKLLLPVLTTALATEGATASSTALYSGTAFFSSLLSSTITSLLIPLLRFYLCICIIHNVVCEKILQRIRDFIKWLLTWSMKAILYIFTAYISLTRVISGTVDATAIKAAKLTISGVVPVIGNILSDASETILVSAGVVKNSVGAYGLIAVVAILIGPFLKIGIQYIFLKLTGTLCGMFSSSGASKLIEDFSTGMGFVLAMTGVCCLLLMISIVCFMKGVR